MKRKDDTPIERRHFHHWVELRDLREDTIRELPITVFQRILLVSKKKKGAAEERPPEIRLRIQDGERTWEALDMQDLARQVREQYPDGAFERTLKCERDFAAEERYESAMHDLIEILAEVTVREMLETEPKA